MPVKVISKIWLITWWHIFVKFYNRKQDWKQSVTVRTALTVLGSPKWNLETKTARAMLAVKKNSSIKQKSPRTKNCSRIASACAWTHTIFETARKLNQSSSWESRTASGLSLTKVSEKDRRIQSSIGPKSYHERFNPPNRQGRYSRQAANWQCHAHAQVSATHTQKGGVTSCSGHAHGPGTAYAASAATRHSQPLIPN